MKLEKLIDGEWWLEGDYSRPGDLAEAAFTLGRDDPNVQQVRVTTNAGNYPRVTLWCKVGQNWFAHGTYTDLNVLVAAICALKENPDVLDFRVQPS